MDWKLSVDSALDAIHAAAILELKQGFGGKVLKTVSVNTCTESNFTVMQHELHLHPATTPSPHFNTNIAVVS